MSGLKSVAAMPSRRRMAQNYLVIWVDGKIDENNDDCRNTLVQLRAVISDVNVCTTPEQCVEFLNEIDDGKAFIISSGALGQILVNDIHGIPKVDAIYIFCDNKECHESWSKDWSKIRGVFTSIKPICESLKKVAHECDHDSIPMSFVPKQIVEEGAIGSDKNNLDRLPPSYMYSIIFKDIILEINDDDSKSMDTLVKFCQKQNISETQINEFKCEYHSKSAFWWYTKEIFLYGMLNRGLRSLDMETMCKLGFFIRSLHLQLKQLHQEQSASFQTAFTVYRGQGLSQPDFQNLFDSKGGLLSFNNFLSTSKKQKVATSFVQGTLERNPDIVGVMFIMTIDPSKISTSITPFAMIDKHSALPREQEILFTMHSVFRIVEITQTPSNSRLWEVQLTITDESDPQLSTLTNHIKEEVQSSNEWYRMGKLMLQVGHFDQAEELYNELLKGASTDSDIAYIYHELGRVKKGQGEYQEAVKFYEKSLDIKRKTLPEDDVSLADTYGNIGAVYDSMGEYSKALEYYEKANKIFEISLPPTHPNLATSYNNIGQVYDNMGEYSKALEYYEKSLKMREKALAPTHPDLADSYLSFAACYEKMGDYTAALKALKNANKIQEKTFQEGNQVFAFTFSWYGRVYRDLKEYSKALDYYEKCLAIDRKNLPEKHPDFGIDYSNIGDVHRLMGDYEKALIFHQKALNIQENVKCNPLECATTYMNVGETYREMKDYTTALTYYQKGLKIREEKLTKNHPDLAVIYHNMSKLYFSTQKYSMAMKYVQQAVEIGQEKLSSTHPHLVEYRETFEKIRKKQ
ncbi:unnamed protein product [Rotaria socialis]|uniref:NAD(P)(+)--arginine ADP-ribosyltransferase n=7 Tax=Rotaria socialis TaxID=392032 RepID=A0A820VSE3_9BILA|nr:unnamed protein product [Rotaria socialis]CAF4505215.1 unnamed protein product [Rotaria socialis]